MGRICNIKNNCCVLHVEPISGLTLVIDFHHGSCRRGIIRLGEDEFAPSFFEFLGQDSAKRISGDSSKEPDVAPPSDP